MSNYACVEQTANPAPDTVFEPIAFFVVFVQIHTSYRMLLYEKAYRKGMKKKNSREKSASLLNNKKEEDNMKRETTGKLLKVFIILMAAGSMVNSVSFAASSTIDSKTPVTINQSTVKELSSLPGIGKMKAEAIIAYREKNGKFSIVEDIKKVEG